MYLNSLLNKSYKLYYSFDGYSPQIQKLAVGSMPEKIITAFQSVHDEHVNEDTVLNKCKAAVRRVGKMEKDVEDASIHGKTKPFEILYLSAIC